MKEHRTRVAVFGARGLVGSEVMRQLSPQHDVMPFSRSDLDVTNKEAVAELIFRERPGLIVNCAVLGVDASEVNPSLAWKVNAGGAENLARAGAAVDAEMIHLSSNYVFDGRRSNDSSYSIDDSPNPINIYGQTKLAGERAVAGINPRSYIIRTSWVFGRGKQNFLSTVPGSLRGIRRIRAITDVWANSTYVHDLVNRIVEIVSRSRHGTYHVINRELCSYYDFVLEAARILGISEFDQKRLISPVSLSELELRAPRPKSTPMACRISAELELAPMRSWREALATYIQEVA